MPPLRPLFIHYSSRMYFNGFDMSLQLLLSQAADLKRPPTQEEVEAELATLGKSGRREGAERTAHRKGELDIMKSMMAQLLQNSQPQKKGLMEPPASSDVGTDVIKVTADKVVHASSQVLGMISNISVSLISQRSMSSTKLIN